jgi:WXG100 family type VII secretion target
MSEYTHVVFGAMEQGQSDFTSIYGQLQETVDSLLSQLQTNLSEWEGSAQGAYHQAQIVWNNAQADMAGVLNQLGNVIGVANQNYMSTEAANTSLWG